MSIAALRRSGAKSGQWVVITGAGGGLGTSVAVPESSVMIMPAARRSFGKQSRTRVVLLLHGSPAGGMLTSLAQKDISHVRQVFSDLSFFHRRI